MMLEKWLKLLKKSFYLFLILLMKIGFQGENNCYSFQVIRKYLNNDLENIGYNSFESVFEALHYETIDFAVLPIENSIGGCIFVNYDLFYKYDVKIHCEFHHEIKHSLYSSKDSKLSNLDKVISHPQALQQCYNNIRKNNLNPIEFWDTTGSLKEIQDKNDKTLGAIGPPNLGELYNLRELVKNFNDQDKNITRFYLISLKKSKRIQSDIIDSTLLNNLNVVKNKFSCYLISKDEVGILGDYLIEFKNKNCNLTKIESRPYLGKDREVFSYIFYIEGEYKSIHKDNLYDTNGINFFGKFPLLEIGNIKENDNNILKVGIIGFGRFGQFIGKQMVNYGFEVYATSRTDYSEIAKEQNIIFLNKKDFLRETKFQVIIISTSILSFEQVVNSYPKEFWDDKLIVDVLSVKLFPKQIFDKYLTNNSSILLTHPMFGPDSTRTIGNINDWNRKNFVYWKDKSIHNEYINEFLDFWKYQGCNMIEMSPDEHDELTANSQFLTHFIGRTLENLNCNNTKVDTDGYKSLVTIKNHSINDSWELFYGLAKFNPKSFETIEKLKYQMNILENKILYPNGKEIKQSETGLMFTRIKKMKENGKDIINSAIGVPTWYPNSKDLILDFNSEYSTSKGNMDLIKELVRYYNNSCINEENIMITSGAKPALYLCFKLLTNVSTRWILPKPYWVSYPDMIESLNGSIILLEEDFKLENIEKLYTGDRINGMILCNPNNPTGIIYDDSFIEGIILLSKKYDKYLIIDEVYLPLTNKTSSYMIANKNKYDKIIIVSSFSKYWALPGWRVGWILSNQTIVSNLVKLQSTIIGCTSNPSQQVCKKLLEEKYSPNLSFLNIAKDELSELFKQKGWKVKDNTYTSMYLFPYNNSVDISELVDLLLEKGLAVIPGKSFGSKNNIRITLPNDILTLNKIKSILNENL